jgi:hypothetical protein
MRFKSSEVELRAIRGTPLLPPKNVASTGLALRIAVGIDVTLNHAWSFRYSFSETISQNPISAQLSPPGQRNLANFQNLFGFVRRF